ncbi:hypothetical protein ES703_81300 [subsurface metagenome]|jgi:hypothetical protein
MIKIYYKRKDMRGLDKDDKDKIASAISKIIPELIKTQKALSMISKNIKLDIQLILK